MFWFFGHKAYWILALQPGIKLAPPALEGKVLTTGSPGNSLKKSLWLQSAEAAAKSLRSCRTLCNPIDNSPPGSSIPGILQARILEWVAITAIEIKGNRIGHFPSSPRAPIYWLCLIHICSCMCVMLIKAMITSHKYFSLKIRWRII